MNFAVFHMFLSISRDFVDIPEFRGSATTRNFRSPGITRMNEMGGMVAQGLAWQTADRVV